jgi:hypothetical protein
MVEDEGVYVAIHKSSTGRMAYQVMDYCESCGSWIPRGCFTTDRQSTPDVVLAQVGEQIARGRLFRHQCGGRKVT